MQWERSNVIGLAKASCNFCNGYGMRPVLRGPESPCSCVFRAVFRACYRRFRECVALGAHTNAVTCEKKKKKKKKKKTKQNKHTKKPTNIKYKKTKHTTYNQTPHINSNLYIFTFSYFNFLFFFFFF